MDKLAYDYTNSELMEAYWKAVAKAAVSNSGLIIDFAGGSLKTEAYYLHGVVLSRLEKKERPFTRGDRVRISPKATYICHSVNSVGEHHLAGQADLEKTHEIIRVFYEKDGKWTLSFKGEEEYRYPADRFENVDQKQKALGTMMSLEAKSGDKVVFDQPNNGTNYDKETALKHLIVGQQYTVERLEVADWSSEVFLREVPGVAFNTVQFNNAQEAPVVA